MPTERAIVTREGLHELLWTSPLRDVARQLHVAPFSLKRACLRLRVPIPGIAHWRRKWQGHAGGKPPLRATAEGEPTEVQFASRRASGPPGAKAPEGPNGGPSLERPRAVVPDQLGPLHPVLRDAMPRILEAAERLTTDPRRALSWLTMLVGVTKPSLDRALRITNTLLFAVETAGHEVRSRPRNADRTTEPSTTGIWVDGEFVDLLLFEHYAMVPLPPLPKRRKETTEEAIARMYRKKVAYRSNGCLTLQVGGRGYGSPKWTDRDRSKLEERLQEVAEEVIRFAEGAPERAATRLRRQEEAREADRRRSEAEAARARDAARLADLRRRAEEWGIARTMRDFVDAVEAEAITRDAMTAEFAAWVAWARGSAREAASRCVSELAR